MVMVNISYHLTSKFFICIVLFPNSKFHSLRSVVSCVQSPLVGSAAWGGQGSDRWLEEPDLPATSAEECI